MKRIFAAFFLTVLGLLVCTCAHASDYGSLWITTGSVNIREQPSIDAPVLDTLDKDELIFSKNMIFSLDDDRTWMEIDWNGSVGYISRKYLAKVDEPEGAYNTSVSMICTSNTEIHCWASIEGPIYDKLKNGKSVEIWGFYPSDDGTIWCEMEIDDGYYNYGYASLDNLQFAQYSYQIAENMTVANNRAIVHADNLSCIGRLEKNTPVIVYYCLPLNDNHIWAMCLDEEGEDIGWIRLDHLQITN